MKKIYYLLCLLPLMPLVSSCDDEEAEVVLLQNPESQPVTLSSIAPDYGFVGDQFTLTGTNFGGGVDFIQVFIGENEAEVLTCTDTEVKVLVPKEATTGRISVRFMGQEVNSDLMFRVMGKPSVEQMKPLFGMEGAQKAWGFVGSEITFSGSELGGSREDVKVIFKGATNTPAEIVSWSEEEFKVKVPEGAVSGKLTLTVGSQTVNTPYEFRLVEHATVSGITPQQGYKGCEVTISGKGLGDETTKGQTKVWFGDKAGTVLSCENEKITVKTPNSLEEGKEYSVILATPFETINLEGKFNVAPSPVISVDDIPDDRYIGETLIIKGQNMPVKADWESINVHFGEVQAVLAPEDYTVDNAGNGILNVTVPHGLAAGSVPVVVEIAGIEFMRKNITIMMAPEITAVDCPLVVSGGTLKLLGTSLGTDSSKFSEVMFGNQVASISSVNETELTLTVPNFTGNNIDNVLISFNYQIAEGRILEMKVPQTINVMVPGNDITSYVLKNYERPFRGEGGFTGGEWDVLSDWTRNQSLINAGVGGLQYPAITGGRDPEGVIALHKWGKAATNGKLYQNVKLPVGEYKVTIAEVTSGGNNGQRRDAVFAAFEGTTDVDIADYAGNSYPDAAKGCLGYIVLTPPDVTNVTKEFKFEVKDKAKDVVLGFVSCTGANVWITCSSVKIELLND